MHTTMPRRLLTTVVVLACLTAACAPQEQAGNAQPATPSSIDTNAEATGGSGDGSSEPGTAKVPAALQSAACEDTTGVTDETITLGVLTDLSGPVAPGGIPWSQGTQAYFQYVNAELGGIDGREVIIEVGDHGYDPQAALQRYDELEGQVLALPLSFGSAMNNAIAGNIPSDCLPVVANNGSVTDVKPGLFYNASTYEAQTLAGIEWYVAENPDPDVAILYQGDVYGQGALAALQHASEELGFEIVSEQSYAIGDQDFTGQLSAIQQADPDVLFMATTVGATFGFFGTAQGSGADWDWLGLQPTFAPAVFDLPLADAYVADWVIATGQPIVAAGGSGSDQAYERLAETSQDLADDPSGLLGWQAGYIMHQALLAAAGSDAGLTRGSVLAALATLDVDGADLGPGTFRFDPDAATPTVPYSEASIVRVDPDTPGFLDPVKSYFTSELVAGFNEQL